MIGVFESHSTKVMMSHLGKMVNLAKADGEFHRNEKRMIRKIGLQNGLDDEEINYVMAYPDRYNVVPGSKKLRFYQLIDFVGLALQDEVFSEDERRLFKSLVAQLSFKRAFAGVLMTKIERGLKNQKTKLEIYTDCNSLLD